MTERQTVPKELKKTAQELSSYLEEIQDSKTPSEAKEQTKRVVQQLTVTLQVISDPKTPQKERAALTRVVQQVSVTLQVISDPKTPQKERAKAERVLKQLNKQLMRYLNKLHPERPKGGSQDQPQGGSNTEDPAIDAFKEQCAALAQHGLYVLVDVVNLTKSYAEKEIAKKLGVNKVLRGITPMMTSLMWSFLEEGHREGEPFPSVVAWCDKAVDAYMNSGELS